MPIFSRKLFLHCHGIILPCGPICLAQSSVDLVITDLNNFHIIKTIIITRMFGNMIGTIVNLSGNLVWCSVIKKYKSRVVVVWLFHVIIFGSWDKIRLPIFSFNLTFRQLNLWALMSAPTLLLQSRSRHRRRARQSGNSTRQPLNPWWSRPRILWSSPRPRPKKPKWQSWHPRPPKCL